MSNPATPVPGSVLPLCSMQSMRCWLIMRPFAIALGAAIVLVAVIQAVLIFRKSANKQLGK